MAFTARLTIELNDAEAEELVINIIESGGYGIGYWARSAIIDDEAKTYTVTEHEAYATVDAQPFVLTHDMLLDALVKRAYVDSYAFNALSEKDGGHIDSRVADEVIQMAAFGEVIYG